jgi:hypothetical protein
VIARVASQQSVAKQKNTKYIKKPNWAIPSWVFYKPKTKFKPKLNFQKQNPMNNKQSLTMSLDVKPCNVSRCQTHHLSYKQFDVTNCLTNSRVSQNVLQTIFEEKLDNRGGI